MVNTVSNVRFFILNTAFESVYKIDQYESLLWVDRYNECGDFEIICPPNQDVVDFVKVNYYLWCSDSDKLMIIEKIEVSESAEDGIRYKITGRSIESILDRRVLLYKTLIHNNLEDIIRQLLDWAFIRPSSSRRKVDIMQFAYSGDPTISSVNVDYEFDKGTTILEVVRTITKANGIGFKMVLTDENKFRFFLFNGKNRSYDQNALPWVIFSPKFNNLISDKYTENSGEEYRNYVYCEGEEYNNQDPEVYQYGSSDARGLEMRELFERASDISHKVIDPETEEEVTLTDAEYTSQLRQRAIDVFKDHSKKTSFESEVESKIGCTYGEDYFIGDIVQVEDSIGHLGKTRVTEFIIQHDSSGLEMYPTFTGLDEEET